MIFLQVPMKEKIEISKVDKPKRVRKKSTLIKLKTILSVMNIAIIGNMQPMISVAPVERRLPIIFGRTFVDFNDLIIPSELEPAELKIEIAARTKPNNIPDTVDITLAAPSISE